MWSRDLCPKDKMFPSPAPKHNLVQGSAKEQNDTAAQFRKGKGVGGEGYPADSIHSNPEILMGQTVPSPGVRMFLE